MTTTETLALTGYYVKANDLNIYYVEMGNGAPLVFLQGAMGNHSMLEPYMPAFAQHFRVIALDSRGHGRTKNPADTMNYRLLADDVSAFIQALNLDKPAIGGYSFGGHVVLELATRYPQIARSYIIGGVVHRSTDADSAWVKSLGMESPGVVNFEHLEQNHSDIVAYLREQQDTFQGHDYWKIYMRQLSEVWLAPLNYSVEDLQKITVPTLILAGDRDDTFAPIELTVAMHQQIPQSELAIVPGGDHSFPIAQANIFTQLIIDFLLRH